MKSINLLLIALLSISILGCNNQTATNPPESNQESTSLKSAFAEDFFIGTALNRGQIQGTDLPAGALIPREFNSITPENVMKWMHIHPEEDKFDFALPDQFVELGEKSDMFIVGHTLVWHSQLAPWAEGIEDKATLDKVMENHINTIVGRYKGRIDGWDVVNEALNDDGSLRETGFPQGRRRRISSKSF
jgi:endo-1,4-beta-xylanase